MFHEKDNLKNLVKKYKKQTPIIIPIWDISITAIKYNNICEEISISGLTLYSAPFDDVWGGIYKPFVYDKNTLWKKRLHESRKIAQIIQHWQNNQALSPIFLVKHGNKKLGLVSDGNHRLTVARYMGCKTMPFMVSSIENDWVLIAIPSATKINLLSL